MKKLKLIRGIIAILITAIALSFAAVPESIFAQQGPRMKSSMKMNHHKRNRIKAKNKKHKKVKKHHKHNHRKHIHRKQSK